MGKVANVDIKIKGQHHDILEAAMFLKTHYEMSDFKETCIWMSYRYAIGRKTIAATSHAYDIAHNMDWIPKARWQFTGIDILREINFHIRCYKNIKVVSYGDPDYDVFSIIFI